MVNRHEFTGTAQLSITLIGGASKSPHVSLRRTVLLPRVVCRCNLNFAERDNVTSGHNAYIFPLAAALSHTPRFFWPR